MLAQPEMPPSVREGPDEGLVFAFDFNAAGVRTAEPSAIAWSWRNYALTDTRARRAIETDPALPEPVRTFLLKADDSCHLGLEEGWLFGEVPDIRHEHYSGSWEFGHLRFAASGGLLVTARRHPLASLETIRQAVEREARRFPSPVRLFEAAIGHAIDQLAHKAAELVQELDACEDSIVGDAWHDVAETLTRARREGVSLHRQIATLTHLFRMAGHFDRDLLDDEIAAAIDRITSRVLSLHHDGELIQARARLLQDELLARLTTQSNRLLYFLSVMTAVLLPMTVVSGLYGMNVGGIPFAESRAGFWIVALFSVAVAGGVYALVRGLSSRN